MQPLRAIQTIRWIIKQVPEEAAALFFSHALFGQGDPAASKLNAAIGVSLAMTRAAAHIEANIDAVEVLKAFGLTSAFSSEYLAAFLRAVSDHKADDKFAQDHWSVTVGRWRVMTGCVRPIETLVIPMELGSGRVPDDIISIEVEQDSSGQVSLQNLADAIKHLDGLYSALARLDHPNANSELRLHVISIQSGSSVRIDCKGLGDVVRHLKELVLEGWRNIRHRQLDNFNDHLDGLRSALSVMGEIDQKVADRTIGPEEGEQLKQIVTTEMLGLFECGALPAEIVRRESVNNQKLLREFSPKLLTGSTEPLSPAPAKAKKSKPRHKPKKAAKVIQKASEVEPADEEHFEIDEGHEPEA
jgi:hypothetical protein